ncbi:MAG: ArnT family glycosyltransferase [Pseudobdellovibrionaceae bacterium]
MTANGDFSKPPVGGAGDQFDYNNLAFHLSQNSIFGVANTLQFRKPWLDYDSAKGFNEKERTYLNSRGLLTPEDNAESPRPFAYRDWGYASLLAGVYKIFGYNLVYGRWINILIFALCPVILFILIKSFASFYLSLIATLILTFSSVLLTYVRYMLTEPLAAVLVLILAALFLKEFKTEKTEFRFLPSVQIGLCLACLFLTKKMFLFSILLIFLILFANALIKKSKGLFLNLLIIGFTMTFLIIPFFIFNISATGHASLLTGTNGWHDMPASYSRELLNDNETNDLVKRREALFLRYASETGMPVGNDIERALVGKSLFFEKIVTQPEFSSLLPKLVFKKISDELEDSVAGWVIRTFALIGFFFLLLQLPSFSLLLVTIPIGTLIAVGLVHGDKGRMIAVSFPIFLFFAANGASCGLRKISQRLSPQTPRPGLDSKIK